MAQLMFTATTNIKKAVGLINGLDTSKFPLLLSRIIGKLHIKDEKTFTEEEEEKLQMAFSLDHSDLGLVIQTCEFFLQQAAYHTAKPVVLQQQLLNLELAEDKVQTIVEAWTSNAKSLIDSLRHRTLAPKQLEDIKWRLNLQMASANRTKLKQPNAMFELGLYDDSTQSKEKIRMEFSHDELYTFYNQLETIQSQIDSLS